MLWRTLALGLCLIPSVPSSNGVDAECADGVVSRLYMGQATPSGTVSDAEWRRFVDETIAAQFPGGFTELTAQGRWRDGDGASVEEATRIVEIVHDDAAVHRRKIRAVAAEYKRRFAQQSVLVSQTPSLHCF